MHVGQTEMAALDFIGQAFVVDAEQVQHRRLEIVDVDGVLGRVVGEVVGLAEREAAFDAAAGHPDREDVGVMVSAERFLSLMSPWQNGVRPGAPSGSAAPDDQRVVEQPALLEVFDQRGARLVGVAELDSSLKLNPCRIEPEPETSPWGSIAVWPPSCRWLVDRTEMLRLPRPW